MNKSLSGHIKDFFSKDLAWKIFSLFIAIIMWFIVMNMSNPIEIKTFPASIKFENESVIKNNGYVITNLQSFKDFKINVKVSATRPALDELSRNKANISATVDLSKIDLKSDDSYPKTVTVPVQPKLPTNLYVYSYNLASYYPSYIELSIDKLSSDSRTLTVDTSGTPATGYSAGTIKCDTTNVKIIGPESELTKASTVMALVDIADAVSDVTKTAKINVYDDKGNRLSNFTCEPSSVTVVVPVSKQGTIAINEPRTTGALPNNLNLSAIQWEPKSVSVSGNTEQINRVKSIDLPAIDLTNIHQSTTLTFDISSYIEQAGLTLKNSSSSIVTVNINIGNTNTNTVTIKKSELSIEGLSNEFLVKVPDEMTFNVIGSTSTLNASVLQPKLNLAGLGEGKHTVNLSLTLPTNVSLSTPAQVEIEIFKRDSESTTAASESEETTTDTSQPIKIELPNSDN